MERRCNLCQLRLATTNDNDDSIHFNLGMSEMMITMITTGCNSCTKEVGHVMYVKTISLWKLYEADDYR